MIFVFEMTYTMITKLEALKITRNWSEAAVDSSEPYQASKNKRFAKTVSGFLPITIFKKHTILNVWQGSEFTS